MGRRPRRGGGRSVTDGPASGAGAEAAASAARELVEVVDEAGTVLDVVTRAEMRSRRLRHRCTYIVVVDRDEQLIVHQRALWKDVWPGRWDVAFGGVVGVGEDWGDAALRELREEAGVEAGLQEIGGGAYDDADVSLLGRVYLARHDGPFTFPDGEVLTADRIRLDDIEQWIAGRQLCPDSLTLAASALGALIDPGPGPEPGPPPAPHG
ncbi:NUDIX domain-containing protein [Aquihabitans sp. McL0605]|uniref:NUDIX domain-containing protein n=1 Tax=Aquihabitans sp. McL0605 TaxID=3415671 RepID=UPI003CF39FF9